MTKLFLQNNFLQEKSNRQKCIHFYLHMYQLTCVGVSTGSAQVDRRFGRLKVRETEDPRDRRSAKLRETEDQRSSARPKIRETETLHKNDKMSSFIPSLLSFFPSFLHFFLYCIFPFSSLISFSLSSLPLSSLSSFHIIFFLYLVPSF